MDDLPNIPTDGAIGQSIARPNAPRSVAGRGEYTDDLTLPRMLDLAFVRSPYAHARIVSIDIATAAALPGVVHIMTGAEAADRVTPWQGIMVNAPTLISPPQYPMAVDRACWQGEPLVAIAATDRAAAEDAAEQVIVEWKELPAVARLDTALDDGTPVLHDDLGTNRLYERLVDRGDVDAGFANATHIVEDTFRFARHTGVPLEPRAIVADFDPSRRKLTVHHCGQAPHMMRILLSRHLDLPERDIRVIAHEVGGSYGIKSHFYGDEAMACVLSMTLGRPVRYRADRIESFQSDIHAREHIVRFKLGVDDQGRITALEVDDLAAAGAYSAYPRTSSVEANQVLNISGGPYAIADYRGRTRVAFQNKVPTSQYRGVGHPIAILGTEALMERAAQAVGIDGLEIRRRNYVPDDGFPVEAPSGVPLDNLSHQACLEGLLEKMDIEALRRDRDTARQDGVYRGIGIAAFIKGTNPGALIYGPAHVPISSQDGVTVRLEPAGDVTCLTGVTEQGQGTQAIFSQIVSTVLTLPPERVDVVCGDTESMPFGGGTYGSRGAGVGGEACWRAVNALKKEILEVAAVLTQADAASLDLSEGNIVDASGGDVRMAIEDLSRTVFLHSHELPLDLHPRFVATERFRVRDYVFTNGIHGCYVEVDTDTGMIEILDYWAVEDVGRIINPLLVEEQVRGAIVTGLGDALYEHSLYDDGGQLLNATMADYLVPMAGEMPDFKLDHIQTPTSKTGLGAKGAGESGTAAAPGTIFNAVNDALAPMNARVTEIPMTPAVVLRALGIE